MASADSKSSWKLTVEAGSEYDSNLHRVEVLEEGGNDVDGGSVLRSGMRYQQSWKPKKGHLLSLDMRGATKVFTVPAGQSENLAIVFLDGRYQRYIGDGKSVLEFRGNFYDAIDIRPFGEGESPVAGRSFRAQEGSMSLTLPSENKHQISVFAGVRDFLYKPDADFSWQGEQLGVRYANMFWLGDSEEEETAASIDVRAMYQIGLRDYEGAAFRNICSSQEMARPECFVPTTDKRADLHHSILMEMVYTGTNIYSLLYGAQIVDSNSYGQASIRQRIELEMTTELPAEVFLTARAIVRINTFLDPLLLARDVQSQSFVSIEDENRNSLSLHFARDLSPHFGVEARLAAYSNEFATEELSFRRQTAYLGGLYRFAAL